MRLSKEIPREDFFLNIKMIACSPGQTSIKPSFEAISLFCGDDFFFQDIFKRQKNVLSSISNKNMKLQISGRLNGSEIAAQSASHEGSLPLNTMSKKINMSYKPMKRAHGIIGAKFWITR